MGYGEGIFFQKDTFPVNRYVSCIVLFLLVLPIAKCAALFCLRGGRRGFAPRPTKGMKSLWNPLLDTPMGVSLVS